MYLKEIEFFEINRKKQKNYSEQMIVFGNG